ncbi:hypothetical protein FHR70_003777 [Microvirga lupini]|uniref:Uncharacterized protein n=1 Tax=Microvirga lupini TaxID=420324 RepID=A0A7W4YY29_9HYPH|nr:hypothetical protein [Microvirga lupini]MBB3020691.1 hypothetical protein [Microvirga lupini]
MKWELIVFSEQVSDREAALELIRQVCQPDLSKTTRADLKAAEDFEEAVERLRKTDPDLAEAFTDAIASGVAAMLFRWSEGATMFISFVAKAISDHKREAAFFSRAVRLGSKRTEDRSDNGFSGPKPLPA